MNNPQYTRKTIHVSVPVAATFGAVVGVTLFAVGVNSGFKLKSLTQELVAHQMIITRLRETAPELVDETVTNVVAQMNGVLAAANPA